MQDYNLETAAYEILVVDDSPMSLRLLTQILVMQGYRVRSAENGAEALAAVEASAPDLILLDVMMPEISGFEVAERLQADPGSRDIPIIFISALSDEDKKVRAFNAGGVDYISKPIHINEVIARVATHLRLRDSTRRLQQELLQREHLITDLDAVNERLKQEIVERQNAQDAREVSLNMMRQTLDRAEALYRISRTLVTSADIPDMLETATESLALALGADRAVILTLDMEAREITFMTVGGPGAENGQANFHEGSSYEELMGGLTVGWYSVRSRLSPREAYPIRVRAPRLDAGVSRPSVALL